MPRVIVCGAGIAGISVAFHLTRAGITDVLIVDPRPPLTLTSDKSTECYRNWWPNRPMVQLMNRSIELMDTYAGETDARFGLNRRGYLYLTGTESGLDALAASSARSVEAGAGQLRSHRADSSYDPSAADGADLFLDSNVLRQHFPFVSPQVTGGVHARKAGWLSAQQLGMWMLSEARSAGATLLSTSVTSVEVVNNQVRSVQLATGERIDTPAFVNAAGPLLNDVAALVGVKLPVYSEAHLKTTFRDSGAVIPRSAPMMIWTDRQSIPWNVEESEMLSGEGRSDLLGVMPSGCHARPEGGEGSPWVIGLWEYGAEPIKPVWPLPQDELYTEVVLRGLSTMAPGLADYTERLPEAVVDGGYYTRTRENRPLAGPAGPDGSFVCGALSGYGIMAACGVGELVAASVAGLALPEWAPQFDLRRYDDRTYVKSIARADSGQI